MKKKCIAPRCSASIRGVSQTSASRATAALTHCSMGYTMGSSAPVTQCKWKIAMPAPKTYTKAQWDEFARRLDALPEKPPSERRVTVRDAMPKVRAHINSARAKGYSLEQLIDQAKQAGIDVTASALRYALQDATKRRASTRRAVGSSHSPGKADQRGAYPVLRKPDQQSSTASGTRMGAGNNKSGSMVIHDAFSFAITPDTENL